MNTSNDSIDTPPEPDLELPADHTPPRASTREEMNELARRVLPGAVVSIELKDGSTRRLTVEEIGVPEWTTQTVDDEEEVGKILSGYGTTYLLVSNLVEADKFSPLLTWPSKSPQNAFVNSITVDEPAETQILAEKTAADLLWRVARYDGQ